VETNDDGELIPEEDLKDPALQAELKSVRAMPAKVKAEVLKMVCGRHMNVSRATAVKRIVRRIRQLMGPESPSPKMLKWWAAEMVGELERASSMVKLGILRTIAEVTGLMAAGGGLASRIKVATNPRAVNFSMAPQKPVVLGQPQMAKIELTETKTSVEITPSDKHHLFTVARLQKQVEAEDAERAKINRAIDEARKKAAP
jgi:hypothetical protein